jgi:putative solute:sodium symporter small subunit
MDSAERHREYWKKNLRMTGLLLLLWFAVGYGVSFYARELNEMTFLGFPLGFYMGAQGSLLVYVFIVWFYARYMNRLDREYGMSDGEDD